MLRFYYSLIQFAVNPTGTTFPNATDNTWFNCNVLTTYYVPTSMVNKIRNGQLQLLMNPSDSKTITQTAKLTRQVRVNNDDTGVVYDGFAGKAAEYW